jgi:hypothetical protein
MYDKTEAIIAYQELRFENFSKNQTERVQD